MNAEKSASNTKNTQTSGLRDSHKENMTISGRTMAIMNGMFVDKSVSLGQQVGRLNIPQIMHQRNTLYH